MDIFNYWFVLFLFLCPIKIEIIFIFFLIFFNVLDNSDSLVEVTQNIVQTETTNLHKHIKAKRRKCEYGFFFWFLYSLCVFQAFLGKLRFDDANDSC